MLIIGSIPDSLEDLQQVKVFRLENNFLVGKIDLSLKPVLNRVSFISFIYYVIIFHNSCLLGGILFWRMQTWWKLFQVPKYLFPL